MGGSISTRDAAWPVATRRDHDPWRRRTPAASMSEPAFPVSRRASGHQRFQIMRSAFLK
jgi:hypothetical protein